jgi:hypothetical protein
VERARWPHFLGGVDGQRQEWWIDGENVECWDWASEFLCLLFRGGFEIFSVFGHRLVGTGNFICLLLTRNHVSEIPNSMPGLRI